jgi:pilus assembly protein CpaB
MVKRGDRVDIIAEVDGVEPRTIVVLQNIEVLAIGTELVPSTLGAANTPKTVTLAVSLTDSLRLKMAMQKGGVSLVLRSPVDKNIDAAAPFGFSQF